MTDSKELKAKVIKVPYNFEGQEGITYKVELATPYGLMEFKIQATKNEKLIIDTIAEEREE